MNDVIDVDATDRSLRTVGHISYLLHAIVAVSAVIPGVQASVALLAIATACMFVPALMQTEGVLRLGAQRAAVVSTAGPPTTILLGWLFLDESLTAWQLLGVALIIGGIVVVDLVRVRKRVK